MKINGETRERLQQLLEVHKYRWSIQAREKQKLPEGDWATWVINAGRAFGKTRTGAETVRQWKDNFGIIHLVARTTADARDTMVEGESGILNTSPPWDKPTYIPSKRKITWNNGAYALLFSAEKPDALRGPQCEKAWADELCAWKYERDTWDMLQMGLRLGKSPQCLITTTPRPTKLFKEIISDEFTTVTHGSTYENRKNLADRYFKQIIKKYEGTRIGRQELEAELLGDVEGALWRLEMIQYLKLDPETLHFERIVVAIDPAVTSKKTSDETAITVAGIIGEQIYILHNISGIWTPNEWATKAIKLYERFGADRVIGEANNGGDLIEEVLRNINSNIAYKKVHASRGKVARAEPIVALYEQKKVWHVGAHAKLEDEMTQWDATTDNYSPNNIDSLVWAVTELSINKGSNKWAR